jgi:polyhydroxybutyrate depolymerase
MRCGRGFVLLFLVSATCGRTASIPILPPADASSANTGSADASPTVPGKTVTDAAMTDLPTGTTDAGTAPGTETIDAAMTEGSAGTPDAGMNRDTGMADAPIIEGGASDGGAADRGLPEIGSDSGSAPLRNETLTIMDQGRARTVIVHAPAHGPGLVALVFSLHGSGETAAGQRTYTNLDQSADTHGFIAAYPEGAIPVGAGFGWNVTGQVLTTGALPPAGSADDNAFFIHAITFLSERYPVDPKRVYASGFSGGARMTSQLGCELSTLVAAVAPFAGLRFPAPCSATRAVSVVTFHGTADTTNPYNGNGPAYWTYSVPSAAQQWGAHNSCATTPTVSAVSRSVELTSYTGCAEGTTVNLYTIAGMGHEVPGVPGGNPAIAGMETMWTFFAAHPLP